jgi:hypothetical protein
MGAITAVGYGFTDLRIYPPPPTPPLFSSTSFTRTTKSSYHRSYTASPGTRAPPRASHAQDRGLSSLRGAGARWLPEPSPRARDDDPSRKGRGACGAHVVRGLDLSPPHANGVASIHWEGCARPPCAATSCSSYLPYEAAAHTRGQQHAPEGSSARQ